jgi:hypothetical protein
MESYKFRSSPVPGNKDGEFYAVRATKLEIEHERAAQKISGLVEVLLDNNSKFMEREERTVFDPKRKVSRRKIDFACEYLGGQCVANLINERLSVPSVTELVSKKGWVAAYKVILDELVSETLSGFKK